MELKYYYTNGACMGWVPRFQKYIQFPTYDEYKDFMKDEVHANACERQLRPEVAG